MEVYLYPFFYLHAREGCMINATLQPLYTLEGDPVQKRGTCVSLAQLFQVACKNEQPKFIVKNTVRVNYCAYLMDSH